MTLIRGLMKSELAIGNFMQPNQHLNVINTRYFPQEHILKIHAKKLAKMFRVTLCQAQEMLSFYYECNDWTELKHCARHSVTYRRNLLTTGACNQDARRMRRIMNEHLNTGSLDISSLNVNELRVGSVAHYLANKDLASLFDDEITHIFNTLYENQTEAPLYTPSILLQTLNNSSSTLFSKKGSDRHWLYDYRYGTKLYCHAVSSNKKRTFLIREFDCSFNPPVSPTNNPNKLQKSFEFMRKKSWYPNYVISYLSHIAKDLVKHTNFDEIAIYRIDNKELVKINERLSSKDGTKTIVHELLKAGAKTSAKIGYPCLVLDIRTSRLLGS